MAAGVVIVSAVIALAYFARPVVLPVLAAWLIAMALKPPVRWLRAHHLPAPLGAALVVTLVVGLVLLAAVHLSRPAVAWLQAAPENIPKLKEKFRDVLRPALRLNEAVGDFGKFSTPESTPQETPAVKVQDGSVPATVFTWTGGVIAGVAETIALVFLLLATGDVLIRSLVRILPTNLNKRQAINIAHEIEHYISRYLFLIALINVGFGAVVALALHLIGMPNAMVWGALAAVLNFIPYLGPIAGVIIVAIAGLLAFDNLGQAMLPVTAYLLLHLIEGNAITPLILGKRFTISPAVIFIALLWCIWLWGIVGGLLAGPLLVVAKVICERVPALSTLSECLSGSELCVTPEPRKKNGH